MAASANRYTLSLIVLLLMSVTVSSEQTFRTNKQVVTLASEEKDSLKVVDIACDGNPSPNHCILSGAHIYRATTKPMGALGDPGKTCYMKTGQSEPNVRAQGDDLIAEDGPVGSCETTVISTINFKQQRCSLRTFANLKAGSFCAAQRDQFIQYNRLDVLRVDRALKCDAIEVVPSLWLP